MHLDLLQAQQTQPTWNGDLREKRRRIMEMGAQPLQCAVGVAD